METKTSVLAVQGMTCRSCVSHVGQALRGVAGVSEVEVRLREGEVVVKHDAAAPVSSLIAALRDAGYPSAPAVA